MHNTLMATLLGHASAIRRTNLPFLIEQLLTLLVGCRVRAVRQRKPWTMERAPQMGHPTCYMLWGVPRPTVNDGSQPPSDAAQHPVI